MSTSLLYHGFGIVGYRYVRTDYQEGNIIFTIQRKEFSLRCPVCNSKDVIRHGTLPRWFHSLPIGRKSIYIKTGIPRIECRECTTIRQADIGFADPRYTYTRGLGGYVIDLARHMTISDVVKHLGLSWDLIKSIQKRYLEKEYGNPNIRQLKRIAIDEIYVGKRGYLTVVLDVLSGAVVFVGDGKGGDALEPFWKKLRRIRKLQIEAVAIDMSPAYVKAVRENLKNSVIVFDHFHVIKMFNEKLSDFRRQLFNVTEELLPRSVLKGTRSLLLTARERLETDQGKQKRYSLSTGPLEGTNNKIKTMQRKAYGFRDMELFKLKIMPLHETKHALVG